MLSKVAEISEWLGRWKQAQRDALLPRLLRSNRIRSVQASLAIEQNTLSLQQVTAVLDGKRVLGPPREVQEVRNAFAAYDALPRWNPTKLDHLLEAHGLLLHGLADDAGQLRAGDVGIYRGRNLVHMAPPSSQLPRLMKQLLGWLKRTDAHPLIASSACHYELAFIHPFSDGNGRISRLWQTLILSRWQPMLAYLPVESVIQQRQSAYYRVLSESDAASDCSAFVTFMLDAIADSLREAVGAETLVKTPVKTLVKKTAEKRVERPVEMPDRILALLHAQPELTLAQAAVAIGKSTSAVERAARKLREQGRLRYIGPQKGGHWEVME
ncbi:MAG: Fic family protein [Dokdonella sp.]